MGLDIGIYLQNKQFYSNKAPYYPSCIFEEYPFRDTNTDKKNEAYASLRGLLKLLKLDAENFGKKNWNPFGSFVFSGQTVLLKPNFMRHFNEKGGSRGIITHGSLIRAVTDYVYIALKGKGRIIIADGPMDDADFGKIARLTGLYQIAEFYKETVGFEVEIYDLRKERVLKKRGKIVKRIKLKGDPFGYKVVDLGKMSEFKKKTFDYRSFRGAECDADLMYMHHNQEKDEYLMSSTFLNSDVVINIPKMKTHKRSGVTLALKNMVGVTGDRNWLPHFNVSVCNKSNNNKSLILLSLKKIAGLIKPVRDRLRQFIGVTEGVMRTGNWHGNDIIWRTILDLAHIALYADKAGVIREQEQRKVFVIVDGIIAGEGDGPLNPNPKPCGVLIAGFNPIGVDMVTSRLMGFDPMKIPKLKSILKDTSHKLWTPDLKEIRCMSNVKDWDKDLFDISGSCLNFRSHYGWKDHVEVSRNVTK